VPCPHCTTTATAELPRRTALGYRTFRCHACKRCFNERTGTPCNHRQYPTDVVLLVVRWRLRHKLRLRDLAEMFLVRGIVFSHEAVRDREARFAPLLADQLRAKRRGRAGSSWQVDETYMRVNGAQCSPYRASDRDGNLVDARPRQTRDMDAAQRCSRQALAVARAVPERVTTDGHTASPRAIRQTLGSAVQHRTSRYNNDRIEQDRRGIKQLYYPMRGFGTVASTARFCAGSEEQRQYFRAVSQRGECVSLAARRCLFQDRWAAGVTQLAAA